MYRAFIHNEHYRASMDVWRAVAPLTRGFAFYSLRPVQRFALALGSLAAHTAARRLVPGYDVDRLALGALHLDRVGPALVRPVGACHQHPLMLVDEQSCM